MHHGHESLDQVDMYYTVTSSSSGTAAAACAIVHACIDDSDIGHCDVLYTDVLMINIHSPSKLFNSTSLHSFSRDLSHALQPTHSVHEARAHVIASFLTGPHLVGPCIIWHLSVTNAEDNAGGTAHAAPCHQARGPENRPAGLCWQPLKEQHRIP